MPLFRALFLKLQNPLYISHKPFSIITRTLPSSTQSKPEAISEDNKKPLGLLFKEAVGLCEKVESSDSESENSSEFKRNLEDLERELRDLRAKNENGERAQRKRPKSLATLFGPAPREEALKAERQDKPVIVKEHSPDMESSDSKSENSSDFKRNLRGKKDNGERVQNKERPKSLATFFRPMPGEEALKAKRQDKPVIVKELSPDMEMFVRHLYKEGYFKDANFFPGSKLDFQCLENPYARDFIKFAAERFGKDNQEIAKWLSGSNLRKVVLFGCPSTTRKTIFSAKILRKFFEIPENTVCDKCVLKSSCKFVNQSVWRGDTKTLNLAVVMRVITLYALDSVSPELAVPHEMRDAVSQLLKEVVKLSQTIAQ
ncbi:hypothetical protein HS088_TW21G00209 [Tripterygium wilfordii]|uniref:Uncharacterized protein n=1 Tax=Tripterygium wilfordii TaxID=458696 RepID=A0A7J7C2S3_TRIWF|nr:uncharacterized protein LOC119989241 [Tripterygium wilfordii]XP_038690570.1 uncharacterized protein LOC119989241 [Tripterygium wilfordii]KAF5728066.1 hypothetical protein HS088_TW21G00209 [Tripterygium wilfordii]